MVVARSDCNFSPQNIPASLKLRVRSMRSNITFSWNGGRSVASNNRQRGIQILRWMREPLLAETSAVTQPSPPYTPLNSPSSPPTVPPKDMGELKCNTMDRQHHEDKSKLETFSAAPSPHYHSPSSLRTLSEASALTPPLKKGWTFPTLAVPETGPLKEGVKKAWTFPMMTKKSSRARGRRKWKPSLSPIRGSTPSLITRPRAVEEWRKSRGASQLLKLERCSVFSPLEPYANSFGEFPPPLPKRPVKCAKTTSAATASNDFSPLLAQNVIAAGIAAQKERGVALIEKRDEVGQLKREYDQLIEKFETLCEREHRMLLAERRHVARMRMRLGGLQSEMNAASDLLNELRGIMRDPARKESPELLLNSIAGLLREGGLIKGGESPHEELEVGLPPSPCSVGAPSRTNARRSVSSISSWTHSAINIEQCVAGTRMLSEHNVSPLEKEDRDIHNWCTEVVASLHGNQNKENNARRLSPPSAMQQCTSPALSHQDVIPPVSRWSTDSSDAGGKTCGGNRRTMHSILVAYYDGEDWGSLVNRNDSMMSAAGSNLQDNFGKRFSLMPAPLRFSQIEPPKVAELELSGGQNEQIPTAPAASSGKLVSASVVNAPDH